MSSLRWWHAAVFGTAALLTALLIIEQDPTIGAIGAGACLAVFIANWLALGTRARGNPRIAYTFLAVVVVSCGVGTAFSPSFAFVQCVAFPLIWVFGCGLRPALIANILLEIAVGIGFLVSVGTSHSALVQTGITCAISLGLSLALGLWFSRVYDVVDERQRLIDALEAAQSELAALSRDAGAASERERLARELHDTIAQDLTGLVMTAERSRRELRDGNLDGVDSQLAVLEENARNALAETRALVASGAAVGIDGSGLVTALRRLGERFERETGIAVAVSAVDPGALDRDGQVVLLRCAQEALANVRKHSGATTTTLNLSSTDGGIELSITDNGHGFDDANRSAGFGLDGMRERLALVHGTLAVTTAEGAGTTLAATLPAATL